MKSLFLFPLFLTAGTAFGQPCLVGGRIQTPAVAKVTETQTVFATDCHAMTISWKAAPGQSYIVTGIYDDKAGGKALPADNVSVINNGRECFATIPLKPGYALQWSIQAVQAVDGRSFYSYPMRGETAGCEKQPIVEKSDEAVARPDISVVENEPKSGLSIFPNPVTGELTINWTGEYRGQANLAILDASGKPVTVMNIRKEQSSYVQRMSANAYSSGIYIIYISMYNGRSVSTRFVKN